MFSGVNAKRKGVRRTISRFFTPPHILLLHYDIDDTSGYVDLLDDISGQL